MVAGLVTGGALGPVLGTMASPTLARRMNQATAIAGGLAVSALGSLPSAGAICLLKFFRLVVNLRRVGRNRRGAGCRGLLRCDRVVRHSPPERPAVNIELTDVTRTFGPHLLLDEPSRKQVVAA